MIMIKIILNNNIYLFILWLWLWSKLEFFGGLDENFIVESNK